MKEEIGRNFTKELQTDNLYLKQKRSFNRIVIKF